MPFPFFPFPALPFSCAFSDTDGPAPFALAFAGVFSQTGVGGVVLPRMFCNDLFPPTAARGTRVLEADGSSGNAAFDRFGGGGALPERAAGPGTDIGPRMTAAPPDDVAAAADEPAQGVFRWPCPRPAGALAPAASGGKPRGGKAGEADDEAVAATVGADLPEPGTGLIVDDAAARATLSRT